MCNVDTVFVFIFIFLSICNLRSVNYHGLFLKPWNRKPDQDCHLEDNYYITITLSESLIRAFDVKSIAISFIDHHIVKRYALLSDNSLNWITNHARSRQLQYAFTPALMTLSNKGLGQSSHLIKILPSQSPLHQLNNTLSVCITRCIWSQVFNY